MINGHIYGRYLDDPFFWPVLARAEALKLPIYLHPTPSPEPVREAWFSGLKPAVAEMMAGPGWGWHIETALHVLRMALGGVFDIHPGLQVVVGHMGETLPFMIERVDVMAQSMTGLKKPVGAYLRENVHYTFAGFNFTPVFLQLLLEVGVGRILFPAHYPPSADGSGDGVPEHAAGEPGRPRANCARQRGDAVWRVSARLQVSPACRAMSASPRGAAWALAASLRSPSASNAAV